MSHPPDKTLQTPPKWIAGHYKLERLLGRGASGECHLASDTRKASRVALKLLRAESPGLERAFHNEAQILSGLHHPNLARVLDFGRQGDWLYLVSEFVEGSDLVSEARRRDWNAGFALIVQAAWALAELQRHGIVHRDLKPANILVGKVVGAEGPDAQDRLQLKLIDFGLACKAASGHPKVPAGGTLAYMSPEQIKGATLDTRSDLYSLGLVLYELALGKLPIAAAKDFRQYLKQLTEKAIDLSPLLASTPSGVVQVIAGLVVKDPQKRIADPLEIIRLLNRCEGESFPERPQSLDPGFLQNLVSTPAPTLPSTQPQHLHAREILKELQKLSRAGKKAEAWGLAESQMEALSKWSEAKVVEEFLATAVHLLAEQGRLAEAQPWQRQLKSHRAFRQETPLEYYLSGIYLALRQGQGAIAHALQKEIKPEQLTQASPAKRARFENYSGLLAQGQKDYAAASAHFERAAEFAGRAGRRDQQASFMANAAGLFMERNLWSHAFSLFQQALELARQLKNPSLVASILNNLGNLLLYFGRWSEAERALTESIELARTQGLRPLLAYNLYLLTVMEEGRGNPERVSDYLSQILSVAESGPEAEPLLQACLAKGYHELSQGQFKAALETAFDLKARAQFAGQSRFVLQAEWLEAKAWLDEARVGEPKLAQQLERVAQDAEQRGTKHLLWQLESDRGRLALLQGDKDRALHHYRRAQELLAELESEVPEPYRASFYRDRKKEALLAVLQELTPASTSIPATLPAKEIPAPQAPPVPAWAELNRRLLAQHQIEPLLEEILEAALQLTGAERGFVLLSESGPLRMRAARNLATESLEHEEMRYSVSVAQEVLRQGRAQVIFDAQTDARFSAAASVLELKLRSLICLPLKVGERCLGLVYLDNRFRQGVFTPEQLPALEALTDQAALVLEHARLHEENAATIAELKKSQALIERLNARLEADLQVTTTQLEAVEAGLRRQNQELSLKYRYDKIIGQSAALRTVLQSLDRIVETEIGIYIYGESGTGKELIAQAIHFNGPRQGKPFITENCAALPETLLESELFGHVRGAFTGADRNKIGLFEAAHGGTLFLDEVGEMSAALQAKLLRVLQEGTLRPVGSNQERKVDVRVICASNRDLLQMVKEKKFRQDLYYRLNVMRINLPPLRERREDIPLLVEHFLKLQLPELTPKKWPRLSPEAFKILFNYDWPGNIRELQNEVSRIAVMLSGPEIGADLLSPHLQEQASFTLGLDQGLDPQVAELEKRAILQALAANAGNKVKAAQQLKISRRTLYLKIAQFGIEARFGKKSSGAPPEMTIK